MRQFEQILKGYTMAARIVLGGFCPQNTIQLGLRRGISVISTVQSGAKNEGELIPKTKPAWEPVEKETHTGQKWDSEDYRLARFIGKEKQINERFAIDLIAQVEPITCTGRVTHCDGGNGPLGHPRVFINLDQPGNHTCGYCGLRFKQEHH